MTKTEMIEILRGKVLTESPEEIQTRLNEIADELEQSERVVHGHWIEEDGYQICSNCGEEHAWDEYRANYCDVCGAKMDEHFADLGKNVDEVIE